MNVILIIGSVVLGLAFVVALFSCLKVAKKSDEQIEEILQNE